MEITAEGTSLGAGTSNRQVTLLDGLGNIISTSERWDAGHIGSPGAAGRKLLEEGRYLAAYEHEAVAQQGVFNEYLAGLRAVLAGARSTFTLEYSSSDGTRSVRAVVVRCQGAIDAVVVACEDIGRSHTGQATIAQQAEQLQRPGRVTERSPKQLIGAEERLRTVTESINLGLYELDLIAGTAWFDASWRRVLGYGAAEIATDGTGWKGLVHPDDWDGYNEVIAAALARGERGFSAELRVRHKNGAWLWIQDTGRVVAANAQGAPTVWSGVIVVINARKEAEAVALKLATRLSIAAEAANMGVWDYDLINNDYEWNDRARQIYGVDARTTGDIRRSFSQVHPEDQLRVKAEIAATSTTGGRCHSCFRIVRPDGAVRSLQSWSLTEVGAGGRPVRSVGVMADVTERLQEDQDRQQARRLESIGQLAAGIAHEINTPIQYIGDNVRFLQQAFADTHVVLTALRSAQSVSAETLAQLIADADLDYLEKEIPNAIEQSVDGLSRVAAIVRAMKEFSHPATEKIPVDLNRAIESTIVVASSEWKYAADLRTELEVDLPFVSVLPGEFNQVILNLIVNAAHAIGEKLGSASGLRGSIIIGTRRQGGWVEITVADTGCGIAPDVRERIFDPFFTTKPVGKGTGQGLAITQNFTSRHGGQIRADPRPGGGTVFTLCLPLERLDQGSLAMA